MSFKYAIVSDDELVVVEWRSYSQPLDLGTVRRLPNGRLKIRPVVETPVAVLPTQEQQQNIIINADEVAITYIAINKPVEVVTAERIAVITAKIFALEQQALEQGLIRTVIDDLLMRSLVIAAQAGVTEAQLLDPESPHFSRAYQKVHANALERALLRAQR